MAQTKVDMDDTKTLTGAYVDDDDDNVIVNDQNVSLKSKGCQVIVCTSEDSKAPASAVVDGCVHVHMSVCMCRWCCCLCAFSLCVVLTCRKENTFWMTTGMFPQELILSFPKTLQLSNVTTNTKRGMPTLPVHITRTMCTVHIFRNRHVFFVHCVSAQIDRFGMCKRATNRLRATLQCWYVYVTTTYTQICYVCAYISACLLIYARVSIPCVSRFSPHIVNVSYK